MKLVISCRFSFSGFGDIVPETDGGKVFLMFYATIGIPVNVIMTAIIGFLMSQGLSQLIILFETKVLRVATVKHMELKTCAMLVTMLIGWLVIGACIQHSLMKWSWVELFYSTFVVYSTIGYGDYSMGFDKIETYAELILWFANVALAIVTGLLEAISRATEIPDEEDVDVKPEPSGNCNEMVDVKDMQDRQRHKIGDSFGRNTTNRVIPSFD